jgi:hypothetical protein
VEEGPGEFKRVSRRRRRRARPICAE